MDDSTDRDYLSISQISILYGELAEYLTTNLKIYLNSEKRISYLALTDNENIFAEKAAKRRGAGRSLTRNIDGS